MRLRGVLAFGSVVIGLGIAVISGPGSSSGQPTPTPAPPVTPAVDPAVLIGATTGADGAIRVVPPTLDFGIGPVGSQHHGSVAIVNTSRETIRVLAAKPSCGCTKVLGFEPRTIPPGAWIDVDVRMTALEKLGLQEKFVTFIIENQRPVRAEVALHVTRPAPARPTVPPAGEVTAVPAPGASR